MHPTHRTLRLSRCWLGAVGVLVVLGVAGCGSSSATLVARGSATQTAEPPTSDRPSGSVPTAPTAATSTVGTVPSTTRSAATPSSDLLAAPPGSTDDRDLLSAPFGPLTTGVGDVDGDGRADRVVLDSGTGIITVHTASSGVDTFDVGPHDASTRLLAVSDLAHDGRARILVSTSASGCCGYHLTDAEIAVFGLIDGSLRHLSTADGADPLSYNEGRGDFYAGFSCPAPAIVTETGGGSPNPNGGLDVWTTKTYRLTGASFTLVGTQTQRGTMDDLLAATATRNCPGLTASASAS